jgi:hypothetical protein
MHYCIPNSFNGFVAPNCVNPHNLWSISHPDTASSEVVQDGDIIVYRSNGVNSHKFNRSGSNNLAIGPQTSNGSGTANIMIGVGCGSEYNPTTRDVTSVVMGTDNIAVGSSSGSISIGGSFNTVIGSCAGKNLGMMTTCLGYKAGTDVTGQVTSGSNNIYINASDDYLHSTDSGRCYIKPISGILSGGLPLVYNTSTGEINFIIP